MVSRCVQILPKHNKKHPRRREKHFQSFYLIAYLLSYTSVFQATINFLMNTTGSIWVQYFRNLFSCFACSSYISVIFWSIYKIKRKEEQRTILFFCSVLLFCFLANLFMNYKFYFTRHHTNPVGTEWKWKMDEPKKIVDGALENHYKMVKQFRGMDSEKKKSLL